MTRIFHDKYIFLQIWNIGCKMQLLELQQLKIYRQGLFKMTDPC